MLDIDAQFHLAPRGRDEFVADARNSPEAMEPFTGVPAADLRGAALLPWSFEGYGAPRERPRAGLADVLTPPSILAVLARGYRPRWRAGASA